MTIEGVHHVRFLMISPRQALVEGKFEYFAFVPLHMFPYIVE